MRIYLGTSSGRFTRSFFSLPGDIHGVSVAPLNTISNEKLIAVSVGGGRGTMLRPPFVFLAKPDNSIKSITNLYGLGQGGGRGRVTLFMDMSLRTRAQKRAISGGPDILVVNLLGKNSVLKHFAYRNLDGNFSLQAVPGLALVNEERAIVTDINGDGVMEVVHFSQFKLFKLVAPFAFRNVTRTVWPGFRNLRRSVSAVVELDVNNDGRMDLYIARARSALVTPRGPPTVPEHADVLLINQGGKYVDVSARAGIPVDSDSMGVTAEDFNNDGYVDVLVTTFEGPDILLENRGNGTFRMTDPRTNKPGLRRGSNVMAFDYNLDGRMDYIVGQAFQKTYLGNFRLMKNQMRLTGRNNFLLVRVGNERGGAATALNAVVTLRVGKQRLVRRVGGRGAQSGGLSYIDTLHFGLGGVSTIQQLDARWTTGVRESMRAVRANQLVKIGTFVEP